MSTQRKYLTALLTILMVGHALVFQAYGQDAQGGNQIDQAKKLEAQRWVAQAEEALKAQQYHRAFQMYSRALDLDKSNDPAQRGLERARLMLSRTSSPSVVRSYAEVVAIRRQQAIARYKKAVDQATHSANAGNFTESLDAVSLAKAIIDTNRQYLRDAEYEQMKGQALNLRAQIEVRSEAKRVKDLAVEAHQAESDQRERRDYAERQRVEKIRALLRRAADLRRELEYDRSLDKLNVVLFLDPNNIAAQSMKEMIEDSKVYREYDKIQRQRGLQDAWQQVDTRDAAIPHREIITYPPDWPQISLTRSQLSDTGSESEPTRRSLEKLKQPIPVSFENNDFQGVVEYLRTVTGLNIFVNWRALEGAGIERGAQVTLQLNNVPAGKALRLILDQVGADLVQLDYSVDDGVVSISTRESLGKNTLIRSYDIRDLLVQAPNFEDAPEFDLSALLSTEAGGGELFSDTSDEQIGLSREELIDQITQLIRDTVQPDSWREAGGLVGSMSELNGTLIVSQTSQAHREVLSLLGQLRETRALQINVEGRFLLVDHNYLEEIGVDLDFQVDIHKNGQTYPIRFRQNSINVAAASTTGLPGSLAPAAGGAPGESLDPTSAVGGNPIGAGALPDGRGMQINAFIGDQQVDLMIRATEAERTATSLTAPRLTFLNGQRAYVLIARQIAFISDLEPIVGAGAVGFDPEVSVLNTGVILDIEGTVSADRRYVTMTVRPSLAQPTIPFRQVAVAAIAGGAVGGIGGGGGAAAVVESFIEVPEIQLTTVRTTISVPDKGTLLLGGQRLMADIEVEAGVPILSKMPIINRAFTNRSTVQDERTLLILVKPHILIQSEREDELFPGLNQSASMFNGVDANKR